MTYLRRLTGADEFTGWHMIGVMFLFFGTIISVNLVLAYFATTSWTGLVVQNSYVESQRFNKVTAERVKSAELGWQAVVRYDDGTFALTLAHADGRPVYAGKVVAMVGHPATSSQDRKLELAELGGGVFSAEVSLTRGLWQADFEATAEDGTPWRHSIRFRVED
jgi:nitrogen fixation protein FixH